MNRVLGTICAIAIIGIIALAVLNRDNYRSICFEPASEESVEAVPIANEEPAEEIAVEPDSLADAATEAISADTLSVVAAPAESEATE